MLLTLNKLIRSGDIDSISLFANLSIKVTFENGAGNVILASSKQLTKKGHHGNTNSQSQKVLVRGVQEEITMSMFTSKKCLTCVIKKLGPTQCVH